MVFRKFVSTWNEKKNEYVKMNKTVYLGFSILDVIKTLI